MNIAEFIGIGRENAVTRAALCAKLGLPDRQVRRLIQEARDRGEVILNDQSGAGYYISNDVGEIHRQYNTNRSRAMSILRQQKHLRRRILEAAEQQQIKITEGADGWQT